jgi:hypothetical protein
MYKIQTYLFFLLQTYTFYIYFKLMLGILNHLFIKNKNNTITIVYFIFKYRKNQFPNNYLLHAVYRNFKYLIYTRKIRINFF